MARSLHIADYASKTMVGCKLSAADFSIGYSLYNTRCIRAADYATCISEVRKQASFAITATLYNRKLLRDSSTYDLSDFIFNFRNRLLKNYNANMFEESHSYIYLCHVILKERFCLNYLFGTSMRTQCTCTMRLFFAGLIIY